jgi:hypothetical protein
MSCVAFVLWFKIFGPNEACHDDRYSETVDLLYSSNSFIFFGSDVMYYLTSILLPQRINSIRSLRLE